MFTKEATAEVKALGDDEPEGTFEALISVFNVVDSYGDVVMPGAFTDTLANWAAKGDPIPTIWSHQWSDIWSHIGGAVSATQTERGLLVKALLDLENPTAAQAYKLMKQRRITQFSFGFDVVEAGWGIRKNEDGVEQDVYELRKLDLLEVGPCLVGVNRSTELVSIKGQPPARQASVSERKATEKGHAAPSNRIKQLLVWNTIQEMQEES